MTTADAIAALLAAIEKANETLDWIEDRERRTLHPDTGTRAYVPAGAVRALRDKRLAVMDGEAS